MRTYDELYLQSRGVEDDGLFAEVTESDILLLKHRIRSQTMVPTDIKRAINEQLYS